MALLMTRWVQVGVVTFVVGVVVGIIVPVALSSGSGAASVGDRLLLAPGGSNATAGLGPSAQPVPLTGAEAVSAGWKDPVLCAPGRGKYFQREGEENPYFPLFNRQDELIGLYLSSDTEMPLPWRKLDELRGVGASPVVDREHWGMYIFIKDSLTACAAGDRGRGGIGKTGL